MQSEHPIIKRRGGRIGLYLLFATVLAPLSMAYCSAQTSASQAAANVARLQHRLEILKKERAKSESGFITRQVRDASADIEDFGVKSVQEINVKKSLLEATESYGNMRGPNGVGGTQRLLDADTRMLIRVGKLSTDSEEFQKKIEERNKRGESHEPVKPIDDLIERAELIKSGSDLYESAHKVLLAGDPLSGNIGKMNPMIDSLASGALVGLYLTRASESSPEEKLEYRMKALKEASDFVLKEATDAAPPPLKFAATIGKIDAEMLAQFSTFGFAEYLSHHMENQANSIRDNALYDFDRMIMLTEIDLDKAQHKMNVAEHQRETEPGGIKFNSQRADELASQLDVTSVSYDPAHGRLILIGKRSSQEFDLDLFADILRLAVEQYEPSFSLDPSNAKDWDSSGSRGIRLIDARYRPETIGRRVRQLCSNPITRGNRTYYYTTLDEFDPDIAGDASRGHDETTQVSFSPEWLRGSKLGWMLYDADMAIKGVAAGFIDDGTSLRPSPAWSFPDFDPIWLQRDDRLPGRANFELQTANAPQAGGRVDLSAVRPALYVTDRKLGTSQDLSPSSNCMKITSHFARHWKEYSRQLPAIGRLEMIYRGYVAARLLVQKYPGLADKIRQLPREPGISQPPLKIVQNHVLRVCYVDGNLVSLIPGHSMYYDIGRGYGGGIIFGVDSKIQQSRNSDGATEIPNEGLISLAAADGSAEQGDDLAAALDIGTPPAPPQERSRLALWAVILSAFIGLGGLFARRFDWQGLADARACAYCERVHARLGGAAQICDAVTAAALFYLLLLPFAAALHEGPPGPAGGLSAALLLAALIVLLSAFGSSWLAMVQWLRKRGKPPQPGESDAGTKNENGPKSTMGQHNRQPSGLICALRGIGAALPVVLLASGLNADAVAGRIVRMFGDRAGERLNEIIGGGPVLHAAEVCLAATLLSAFLRWVGPRLLDSRPLFFLWPTAHTHQGTRQVNS